MLTLEQAKRRALKYLETIEGIDGGPLIMDEDTVEYDVGWAFYYNSSLYLETLDDNYALYGNPPVLVDRRDGAVYVTSPFSLDREVAAFRQDKRNLPCVLRPDE